MRLSCVRVLFCITALVTTVFCQTEDLDSEEAIQEERREDAGRPMGQPMSFKTPDVNEEEQHSTRIPSNLLCDGCKVAAYQLGKGLRAYHDLKYKKQGKLAPESEIIDVVEKICRSATFEGYGLKTVNGVNKISGPGMPAEKDPGMMQGGGRWPRRMATICGELIGVVDEYDIYKYVLDKGQKKLKSYLCSNEEEEALNACAKEVPKAPQESKDEEASPTPKDEL